MEGLHEEAEIQKKALKRERTLTLSQVIRTEKGKIAPKVDPMEVERWGEAGGLLDWDQRQEKRPYICSD